MKQFMYDLETTGLDENKHAIHQMAGLIIIDGKVVEEFNFKIRPFEGAIYDEGALKIGGVTKEQLQAYPLTEQKAYKAIVDMLSKYVDRYNRHDKMFLNGYNVNNFDNKFFRKFFERNNDKYFGSWFWAASLDTMTLAAAYLGDRVSEMVNFKQGTVAEFLGVQIDKEKLHDALYDIYTCKGIYDIVTRK